MHPTPHPKLLANSDFFPTNFVPFSTKQNQGNFLFFYVISTNFVIYSEKNRQIFDITKSGKKPRQKKKKNPVAYFVKFHPRQSLHLSIRAQLHPQERGF
jgi:hypothetical protein